MASLATVSVASLQGVARRKPGSNQAKFTIGFLHPEEEYGPAFRDYGIDVLSLEIEAAAEKIRGRSIADYLIEALDDWAPGEPDKAMEESRA